MTMTTLAEPLAAEIAAARLAARWWSRPLPEEIAVWADIAAVARETAAMLGVPLAQVDRLERALSATAVDALLEEYERLFVGPGQVPCPPYESLWRSDTPRREQGTLMGNAAESVVQLYRELDLAVRGDAYELPDHIVIEWEALAYAFETQAQAAARLLDEHLAVWLPSFCDAVESNSELEFYRALASLSPCWLVALRQT
jgi:TorA maturation chaperone TorD